MLTLFALVASVLLALTQAGDPSSLSPIGLLILTAAPGVIGYLATFLYDGLKTIIPIYDRQKAIVHMVIAPIFAFGLGFLSSKIGFGIPLDIRLIDGDILTGILTTLANAGIFRFFKRNSAADATRAVEASRTP